MRTDLDPSCKIDRLYELLPAVYRARDNEQGEPLRALLQVVTEQVQLLEDDLEQLYDNWFIETCEPWAIPYIADLIGHAPIHARGDPEKGDLAAARNAVLLPRREVANTLRYRRRKGTLVLLEQLAQDVGGWPALAVELGRLLDQTQSLRLPHQGRGRSVDLRDEAQIGQIGSGFDRLAHFADLRRVISTQSQGRYSPSSVGVFIWRLKAYSVTRAPASCREDVSRSSFTFSALGNNAPLFNRPGMKGSGGGVTGPVGFPQAIDRPQFAAPKQPGARFAMASTDYYGLAADGDGRLVAQSLAIWAPGWPPGKGDSTEPIPASKVIAADLEGWVYQPPKDHVAVDPALGRIAFPPRQPPGGSVWVSYCYGFSADIGGGEYTRPLQQKAGAKLIRVQGVEALAEALKPWGSTLNAEDKFVAPDEQPEHAVIELGDSGVYVLPLRIFLAAGHSLQLRAAQRKRPVLRMLDWQTDRPDNMVVEGEPGSRFTLDGLMLAGRGVQVQGALASFTVRHSTLVPGWSLEPNCDPMRPADPSIAVYDSGACVVIEHSIIGSIQVNNDEVQTDPIRLNISDSVVDAAGSEHRPDWEAIGAAGTRHAFATLRVARSTVLGRVMVHAVELAEDSLLMGCVAVARRQIGCLRFSYVAPGSRTPRRFQCQPDLAESAAEHEGQSSGASKDDIDAAQQREQVRVRPRFDSTRYGTPTYGRLSTECAKEIARGAADESEMGVFHNLFVPQRTANLQTRLEEYSPAGVEAGVLFAN